MNTPVTLEIAKLLKEREMKFPTEGGVMTIYNIGSLLSSDGIKWSERNPTIAEVVMWLYEKHSIWIKVDSDCYGIEWFADLSVVSKVLWEDLDKRHEIFVASKQFNIHKSPAEAYTEAILYTLKNFIQ